ncbi:MAG: hypothetical protein IKX30_10105 [Victivallales bacterium]|nr:hypothetical protein [Victivallales bacterium]
MSFWWLDPEFALFLLFLLTMMWGILLTYAIVRKESIKWILLLQVVASIIYGIAWLLECIEQETFRLPPDDPPPLIPESVFVGITFFSWAVCAIGFFAEFFLLAYRDRHGLSKRLCAQSLGVSVLQMIAYFWIFIIMIAPNSC